MLTIDFHVHIDESENANWAGIPIKMGRDQILAGMEEAGIDISVLLVMAKKGDLAETRAQNNWLSNICREDSHFEGFGSVHPGDGVEALEEMNRCVKELGLKGFKLHPDVQAFDCGDPALIAVLKRAAELDVPVIIDSYSTVDDAQPSKLARTIMSSPETKICLAHVGMWRFMDFGIYGLIKQRTAIDLNVYFDLSASITLFYRTPFQEQFCWVTKQMGPDNLLFGSDFPRFFPKTGSNYPLCPPKFALEAVQNFGYPEDWIQRIVGENAAKLLHL